MASFSNATLSPTLFLERAEAAFGNRRAVIDGSVALTYDELADRARRVAGALIEAGVRPGERVAALCANSHVMLELHNGIPMAGAVIVPLNVRLSTDELSYILDHSDAQVLVATEEFWDAALAVARRTDVRAIASGVDSEYEHLLETATPRRVSCVDEQALLAISYTSGSTGNPKGVMYSHRGSYLQGLAMAYHSRFGLDSIYLWTLPMFHCNGWACTWAVTAGAGTHLCQRTIDPAIIWSVICSRGVTHFSGAPTVLMMIAAAADADPSLRPSRSIAAATGGAPPSPALLERLAALGIAVTHFYGLTETYGPAVINEWQPEWFLEPADVQAGLNAKQGIGNVVTGGVRVVDPTGCEVPADGKTLGEIVLRGNNVMLGYYKDSDATDAATIGDWFRTGDLGVRFPNGYVELKDRAKDVIISGGENIASVEIEQILTRHRDVLEVAVIGRPDDQWGEVPVAFVTLKPGASVEPEELIAFARERTAHFKAPKAIFFGELPKTSTGKVEKFRLRAEVRTSRGGAGEEPLERA